MSLILPRRPPANHPFLYPFISGLLLQVARRHESSARRTTKRLRNKSDPSFRAAIPPENLNDHIVFNPPSSAPSPYHTPPAFLPANDPRRTLLSQSHLHSNPYTDSSRHLPPLARKVQKEKKYHLTPNDIEEIRKLRTEDPWVWTRKKLAEKFECSQFFIGIVAEAPAKKKDTERAKLDDVKERWGRRRRDAREDRAKRRELWGMDK
ncbi:MAG: hypothetical protein Q9164_001216 [Protoblastenia rupestris]